MKRSNKIISIISIFVLYCLSTTAAWATDLTSIYRQAVNSDPTFQNETASYLESKQNIPIARSALLPALTLSTSGIRSRRYARTAFAAGHFYQNDFTYGAQIDQSIFNVQNWARLNNAKAGVKASFAGYNFAAQDLMFRVAQSYFSVLEAADTLRFTQAEGRALERQLEQAQQRYKVGLIAVTSVYDVQAQYDSIVAQEIAAKNEIANRLEELREITGQTYANLLGLTPDYPLTPPNPASIDQWVHIAEKQNYNIEAARYTVIADRSAITAAAAARYPTLDATGSFDYTNLSKTALTSGPLKNNVTAVGLAVNFPVYRGGGITANTRRARYRLDADTALLEQTFRSAVSQTRQAYLGVLSGISKIKADKQAIVSSESSLKATEASYSVGQRTMVDVLLAQSRLYQTQQQLASDQYDYILDNLELKEAAGTLSPDDLAGINKLLSKRVNVVVDIPHSGPAHIPVTSEQLTDVKPIHHDETVQDITTKPESNKHEKPDAEKHNQSSKNKSTHKTHSHHRITSRR